MAGNSLKSYFHLKSEPAMIFLCRSLQELFLHYTLTNFPVFRIYKKKDKKKSLFYFLLTSHLFLKHRFFFVFQLTDALTFLHVSCRYVHRNVCPNSVYVTKSGSWKLGSLEFMGEWRFSKYILKLSVLFIHTTTNSRIETRIFVYLARWRAHLQNKCFALKFKFQRNASKFPIFI